MPIDVSYEELRPVRSPCVRIRARRIELGLDEDEVAARAGISIDCYWDLEQHADEIYTVTPFADVIRVAQVLGLELEEIFQLRACSEHMSLDSLSTRRAELGLTTGDLSDRVGILETAIVEVERGPARLLTWVLDPLLAFAHALDLSPECFLESLSREGHRLS